MAFRIFSRMLVLATVVFAGSVATARPPYPPPGDVTIQPREWGAPFMAATAPDDAIINGRFPGDVYGSSNNVRIRAQQLCSYYGYGQLIDFGLGHTNRHSYVTIEYGWNLAWARADYIQPFRDQYGRVVGYTQGFAWVRCERR